MNLEEQAKSVLQNMQSMYADPRFSEASLRELPHLRTRGYEIAARELLALKLKPIADIEYVTLSQNEDLILAPTINRCAVSSDGAIVAEYYQCRPRMKLAWKFLLQGLLNLRWIASPVWFLQTLRTEHCYCLESEFSDGCFVTTSNAQLAHKITSPPGFIVQSYPSSTPVSELLMAHEEAVRTQQAKGLNVVPCHSLEDVIAAAIRQARVKREHRRSLNWVTREELRSLSPDDEAADAIYDEIQKLLQR